MQNLFWNRDERRLRALWRLLIVGVAWLIASLLAQIASMVLAYLTGAATLAQPTDAAFITNLLYGNAAMFALPLVANLATTLGILWLAGRILDRRPLAGFGLHLNRRWWADLGFGLLLGALLMAVVFAVEVAAGWVTVTGSFELTAAGWPFALAIPVVVIGWVATGIEQELFSRGYLLTNLAEGLNGMGSRRAIVLATLLSSMVFGVLHLANPGSSLASTLNLMLAGVLLAAGYLLTGDLAISIGLHITWNFFEGNVFGFPVSGLATRPASFLSIQQGGPTLWTGGAFGPEAGLINVAITLLGIALIALWVRWRTGRAALAESIAQPPQPPAVSENVEPAAQVG